MTPEEIEKLIAIMERDCDSCDALLWSNAGKTADALRFLLQEVKRKDEALKPFVRHGIALGAYSGDAGPLWISDCTGHRDVPAEDFIAARQALGSPGNE